MLCMQLPAVCMPLGSTLVNSASVVKLFVWESQHVARPFELANQTRTLAAHCLNILHLLCHAFKALSLLLRHAERNIDLDHSPSPDHHTGLKVYLWQIMPLEREVLGLYIN